MKHLLLSSNKVMVFFLLVFLECINQYIVGTLVISKEMHFSALSRVIQDEDLIMAILDNSHHKIWMSYIYFTFSYGIKILFVSTCLMVGSVLLDIKISFKRIISIALISEIIFIAVQYIETFWLLYINIPSSKEEVHSFNPLSLYGLIDLSEYGLNGILKELNLFQIVYCLSISYRSILSSK